MSLINKFKYVILYIISDKIFYQIMFRKHQGYFLKWNKIISLNEKIQFFKLYDRKAVYQKVADKLYVRDYIKGLIGEEYLVPMLYCTSDVEKIPWNELEYPCIVKSTHASGHVQVINNVKEHSVKSLNRKCKQWLKFNYYKSSREWQYSNIQPRIIIEKLLQPKDGDELKDFKFHCINGKVEVIQVDIDRVKCHRRNLYDTKWNLLPFEWSIFKNNQLLWPNGKEIPKPTLLDKMITLSERISYKYTYVRIDWYEVEGQIYFGEITLHHGSGYERIVPRKYDILLGSKIDLNDI
jgi:hypothetical protein